MDYNRERTIKYILNIYKNRGLLKKRIPHECYFKKCMPKNILSFLNVAQITHFSFDPSVWVCLYQKIHICSNSICAFSYPDESSHMFCPLTGKRHTKFISDVEIQNKKHRIPSKMFCSIPQDDTVLEHHRYTTKMKAKALEEDQFYNQYFFKIEEKEERDNVFLDGNISIKFIKRRERKIKEKKINKDKTPSNFQIVEIIRYRKPLPNKEHVYLNSSNLFKYFEKLNVLDFLVSTEDVKISNSLGNSKSRYVGLIATAEYILPRILPGIYRIKRNWALIETLQTKAYTEFLSYIKKCLAKRSLTNKIEEVLHLLDFDKKWKYRHTLTNWVSFEKWVVFFFFFF